MYGAVLDVDGTVRVIEQREGEDSLSWLQRMVGGYIEPIAWLEGTEAYVNEEGKLEGLAVNFLATLIWYDVLGFPTSDVLCGPVAMVGPLRGDGETTGADARMIGELAIAVARTLEEFKRKEGLIQ